MVHVSFSGDHISASNTAGSGSISLLTLDPEVTNTVPSGKLVRL